jgi:hypothetical protein
MRKRKEVSKEKNHKETKLKFCFIRIRKKDFYICCILCGLIGLIGGYYLGILNHKNLINNSQYQYIGEGQ